MIDAVRTFSSAGRLALGRLGLLGPRLRPGANRASVQGPRGRLFRKYVLLFIGLVSFVLLLNSALDFWFTYDENKTALFLIQQEKAGSAARRIEQFVDEIERQLGWTTAPQWAAGPLEQRKFDYVRLLRQVPAITELIQLDDSGKEQLKVSRLAIDVIGSEKDYSETPSFIEARKHRVWFSPVYFRKESEPYMTLAMARAGRNAGVTVAEVNLKLIWDVITGMKIGQSGYAYVVDRDGRLIAHPDISLVLRNTDLSKLPQVAAARAEGPGGQSASSAVMIAKSIYGGSVLTAHAAIAPLGWTVFVELPLSEALAPLYGSAWRSAGLLTLALGLATLAALILARRMVVPIRMLQAGAARIGAGELDRRIDIRTGDELEGLAGDFNSMAGNLQKSYAGLERKVEDRTAELKESLDQQTATAEVLGIISSSPGRLEPVFDAMLANAVRICGGAFGILALRDGDGFRGVAVHGVGAQFREGLSRLHHPPPDTGLYMMQQTARTIQVPDCAAEAAYDPVRAVNPDFAAVRTALHVPMLKEGALLGAILIFRDRVMPFGGKQIELVENFSKQAVIAIENARLITETREALEQQTATAEVLGVINSSPGDLAPVFDAMLEKATRLCEAAFGLMSTYDGEQYHTVATHGVGPELVEFMRAPPHPDPERALGRIARGEDLVLFDDIAETDVYRKGDPRLRAIVDLGGAHSYVMAALRKERKLLGIIAAYRQEVRPFSDKQIALLQNFAAQAVIAMENARLITETREALEQQTATAEVLQVINSSPGDLAPVFDAILEKAHSLCGAAKGSLVTFDGEHFRVVAMRGLSEEYAALLRSSQHNLPGSPPQRLLDGESLVEIPDMRTLPFPIPAAAAEREGARTVIYVPLRKDAALLGYITAYRQEVRPFSDKQIALLQNFAAQAVIAMENARLITETHEALEQQTATAEVLQVINSSPGNLAPVFDAMLAKAFHLCEGVQGSLWTFDRCQPRFAAAQGLSAEFVEILREQWERRQPSEHHPMSRLMRGERVVQLLDIAASDLYLTGDPTAVAAVELGRVRTLMFVALLKDDAPFGAFIIARREVRPFTDKQIALLQNFAAQAVIAMENARLITETREALDQQTATAEVLGVINSSPGDLAPVFDAILEKAHSLCGAAKGALVTYDGEHFRAVATRGLSEPSAELLRAPQNNPPGSPPDRMLGGESLIHIPDFRTLEFPIPRALVELDDVRTALFTPLRKDSVLLGYITAYRLETRPFSDKQIALLQNFAAQAVIAMENARLITETREALDQQTATAEVLGVINSSPGDLTPVFDAMLERATRLCDSDFGIMNTYDGENLSPVAFYRVPPAYAELVSALRTPSPSGAAMRIVHGEDVVHIEDATTSPGYQSGEALPRALVELASVRSDVAVALRKDGRLLGTITVFRQAVRPFTEKQIALLQNFAAQAVIAMENARLITETREALEQQTATAEVLQVINSSPGDLKPVFDAILEKAHALCDAPCGSLQVFDGELFRAVATRGLPEAYATILRRGVRSTDLDPRAIVQFDFAERAARSPDNQNARIAVEVAKLRTVLFVPLRKDDVLVGRIAAGRQEARPFSDKQIALLQNFAAQAVIAMENARLITETREALDQQTATAEVLGVINSSPGDLAPVFDAMLDKAIRLCEATHAHLFTYDGERFHLAAARGEARYIEWARQAGPVQPYPNSPLGRIKDGERIVHVADIQEEEVYRAVPIFRESAELRGVRSQITAALIKDNILLGAMVVYRQEVRPFSDKQIALLQNFAAQAVVAMENARLLGELRGRTRDLQESLEYQTATSDVLKVISRSGAEIEPVLQTLVETAARICEANMGQIYRLRDGRARMAASFGSTAEFDELLTGSPIPPGRKTLVGRTMLERRVVCIEDAANDSEYWSEAQQISQIRTALGVPLLREDALIGVICLARSRVEPFTEKQIALVSTFADQAVIAIENARLFSELRDRTVELGRTVEELKLLSEVGRAVSSTLDLRSVLSTILNASLGVTWANAGAIFRYSRAERAFRLVEAVGWDEALTQSVRELRVAETESAMGEAAARRVPIQLADLADRASYPLRDITLAAGFHSALIVPLVGAERILGAIILMRQMAGEFPPETVRLIQTLASQSVLAIQNARLFREIADKSEQLALASQHKSQFLANMSHELRTPLNAILGYAELLVDGIYGALPDRPKGVLERVQNNGRHLLALINDVLDLAKIEAGQLTLTLEDYSLPEVVHSVVTATEPLATGKGLKFTASLQADMPKGHGDAHRLSQVLLNLVGNAIKFTDEGAVEICGSADRGQFILEVRDTGPGIPDADQDRIFGEFQQIDNSNTRKKGGTGLGLAISKRMVEMQGGTISVDSVLGRGSTFRVVLPVHVDEVMEAA